MNEITTLDKKVENYDIIFNFPDYVNKCIELKTLEDVLHLSKLAVAKKREELQQEEDKLNKIHDEVWKVQNSLCDETWMFWNNHDFRALINQFPNYTEAIKCSCLVNEEKQTYENTVSRALQNPKVYALTIKVEELENEIEKIRLENNLEQEIENAQLELQMLSEDDEKIMKQKAELALIQKELEILYDEMERAKIENKFHRSSRAEESSPKKPIYSPLSFDDDNMSFYCNSSSLGMCIKYTETLEITSDETNELENSPNYVRNFDLYEFVKAKTLLLRSQNASAVPAKQMQLNNSTFQCESSNPQNNPEKHNKFVVKKQSDISRRLLHRQCK